MASPRKPEEWRGLVERYIRKVVIRGHRKYRVQVGGTGRGNRKSKVCDTLEEALAAKAQLLASKGNVVDASDAPTETPPTTVEDAIYQHAHRLREEGKASAGDRTEQIVAGLQAAYPGLLALPLVAVTDKHIATYRDRRREAGISDGTIVRDFRSLRAAIKAWRPDFKITAEVFPPENLTRVRLLTDDRRAEVVPYMADVYGLRFARMAQLALMAVMRLTEVRTLRRSMVNRAACCIELPRAKEGPRLINLTPEAVAVLDDQMREWTGEYVFANPRTGRPYCRERIGHVWRESARACGLTAFTFHDLRHHAPTLAATNGANDRVLMAMGGWKTTKSVARYAHALNPAVAHYLSLASRPGSAPPSLLA
jgi:integrase